MPRPCSICRHPECQAIEQALAAKAPYRMIAERFGTSPAALHRHQQAHAQPPADVMPMGAQTTEAAPPREVPALVDAARRVQASACLVQRQTRALRSVYELGFVERLEGLANVLVEVTRLLGAITTGTVPPVGRPLAAEAAALHQQALEASTPLQTVLTARALTGLLVRLMSAGLEDAPRG